MSDTDETEAIPPDRDEASDADAADVPSENGTTSTDDSLKQLLRSGGSLQELLATGNLPSELADELDRCTAEIEEQMREKWDNYVVEEFAGLLPIPHFPVTAETLEGKIDDETARVIVAEIRRVVQESIESDALLRAQLEQTLTKKDPVLQEADSPDDAQSDSSTATNDNQLNPETILRASQHKVVQQERSALESLVRYEPIGALTGECIANASQTAIAAIATHAKAGFVKALVDTGIFDPMENHRRLVGDISAEQPDTVEGIQVPEGYRRVNGHFAICGFCEHDSRHAPTIEQILQFSPEQSYQITKRLAEALEQYIKTDGAKFMEVIQSESSGGGTTAAEQTSWQRKMHSSQTEKRVGLSSLLENHPIEGIAKEDAWHLPPELVAQFNDIGLSIIIDTCNELGIPLEHRQPIDTAQMTLLMKRTQVAESQPTQEIELNESSRRLLMQLPPNTARIYTSSEQLRSKEDVIGLEDQWRQLEPMLYRLMYPGAVKTRAEHALMVGYYGVGKSLTAEAVAREVLEQRGQHPDLPQITFINVNLANVFYKWVGESNQNVNRVLDLLKANAPCIAFFDELEAAMSDSTNTQMHEETLRVQSTFMQAIDGMDAMSNGVAIIAATNRPDALNQGLLRGSRFGKAIHFPMPNQEQLIQMIKQKANILQVPFKVSDECLHTVLAPHVHGDADLPDAFTGADVEQLIRIMDEDYLVRLAKRTEDPQRDIDDEVFQQCYDQLLKERTIRRAVTAGKLMEYIMHTPACPVTSQFRTVDAEHQAPQTKSKLLLP